MKKIILILLCMIIACITACGRNLPSQESLEDISDSYMPESRQDKEPYPDSNTDYSVKNCAVLVDDFLIDRENSLFFYKIDSHEKLHVTKIMSNVISVIPYAIRYSNVSISDVLTEEGAVYSVDWTENNVELDTSPQVSMSLKNVIGMKRLVGCNLFLKDDNSLWTFKNDVSKGSNDEWPIDASALDWYKIFDDVAFAASSADGDIVVVKDESGRLHILRNRISGWQHKEDIATDVKQCFVFFDPVNTTGEYGMDLFYTDSDSNLYKVVITEEETGQAQKIDEKVTAFASYYDMTLTNYKNHNTLLKSGDDKQNVQLENMPKNPVNLVLSENSLIENNHLYVVKYGICLAEGGFVVVNASVTDFGERNDEGI